MNVTARLSRLSASVAAVLVLATAMSVLRAAPADAHVVALDGYVYVSDTLCVQGDDEVSHGTSGVGGYAKAVTIPKWAQWMGPGDYWHCRKNVYWTTGGLGVAKVLFKWHARKERWEACRVYDWKYNQEPRKVWGYTHDYQRTPCGNGYYFVQGYHGVKNGQKWYWGTQWTKYHWWPTK